MTTVLSPAFVGAVTIFGALLAFVVWPFSKTGDAIWWIGRVWSRLILWFGGVDVRVSGLENVKPGQSYVFMSNHLSSVDIWVMMAKMPIVFRMIAKKQLAKIPFLGWGMRAGRFIFIDRSNPTKARETIRQAAERVKAGESLLLFPEGTRSRTGDLLPFKKGGAPGHRGGGANCPGDLVGDERVHARGFPPLATGSGIFGVWRRGRDQKWARPGGHLGAGPGKGRRDVNRAPRLGDCPVVLSPWRALRLVLSLWLLARLGQ